VRTYQDGIRDAIQWLHARAELVAATAERAREQGLTTEQRRCEHRAQALHEAGHALAGLALETQVGDVEGRG